MTVADRLREALAHLDAAVDLGVSPLRQASIKDARRAIELVLADVLREGGPPPCKRCNGSGRLQSLTGNGAIVTIPCPGCDGEKVERLAP